VIRKFITMYNTPRPRMLVMTMYHHITTYYTNKNARIEGGKEKQSHPANLEKDTSNLFQNGPGWLFWYFGLFQRRNTGDEVHLVRLPDFGALVDLPAKVESEEQWDVDVSSEEASSGEIPEDFETVNDDEQAGPEDTPVGEIWLQIAVVDKLLAVESLRLESTVEEDVGNVDTPPAEEATDGGQVNEPIEHGSGTAGYVHE